MNDFWFFLSYARLDTDEYVKRFYRDLSEKVRFLAGLQEHDVGFFDESSVEAGHSWPPKLLGALQATKVFVSLYSPSYFNREFCGKEWEAFHRRVAAGPAELNQGLMLPIVWTPQDILPTPLPQAVAGIQFSHLDFGENYAKEGLRQLMALKKYEDDYQEFLVQFARVLIKAARSSNLPAITLPPLPEIPSAFHLPTLSPQGETNPSLRSQKSGPRYVRFVLVAGTRDELAKVRTKVDFYGENGGDDWRPYWKDVTDELIKEAQILAAKEGFITQVDRPDNVVELVTEARSKNNIVVILVDTWTLKLTSYQEMLRKYDGYSFFNCVLMIPWNNKDNETVAARVDLIKVIGKTFESRASFIYKEEQLEGITSSDQFCILDGITSWEEMMTALSNNLNLVRRRIAEKTDLEFYPGPSSGGPGIPTMSGRKIVNADWKAR